MELKLPELGEGVHEGELIKWSVKVGDTVKDDQIVCEIMTDKATIELPSPFHGKVTSLMAKEGETIKVGQSILSYEGAAAKAGASAAQSAAPQSSAKSPAPTASAGVSAASGAGNGHAQPEQRASQSGSVSTGLSAASMTSAPAASANVAAAPSTRKFAREVGVDLGRVSGSGPAGRILREDVERLMKGGAGATAGSAPIMAYVPQTRSTPAGGEERVPFRGLRKKISEKMRLSMDKAAHFTFAEEADASNLVELRSQAKDIGAKYGIKVTYLPFIMKAMVAALKQYPIMNSSLDEERGELVIKHYYNISLSIQTDDGLTAPVIKDVAGKPILQIAKEIQDTVERARHKKLTTDDFHGGGITLTSVGSIGGLFSTPVINFPEVAILGFNSITRKPAVKTVNGREELVISDRTIFTITCDHRIVDGAIAAEFLKTFIKYIETPSLLLLEGL